MSPGRFKSRLAAQIHPTALVHPRAKVGYNVTIGPYAVIGANVELGDHCMVGSGVSIDGWTKIGKHNQFFSGAAIGYEPQAHGYRGEETYLYIGDHNIFREKVTVHCGTENSQETRIGDYNLLMPYAHVAHDCRVGDHIIFSTGAGISGHVSLEDRTVLGSLSGVHQFCKVGMMVKIGAVAKIVMDVPPFIVVDGNPAQVSGVNLAGLRRNAVTPETVREIEKAYRLLYHSNLRIDEALAQMEQELQPSIELTYLIKFIRNAKRGIQR
jgi:UDP-N-acetylglucosamine acyltransferase